MSPCGIAGAAADLSSGMSAISASVVSRSEAIDAAFCSATRSTLAGSIIPAWSMSTNSMLLWHGSRSSFLLENGEDVFLPHDQVLFVVELHLGAGVLPEQDLVPGLHVERDLLALVGNLAVADGFHLALLGLLLGRVRDDDPALLDLFLLEPLHQKPIVQRTNLHTLPLLLRWTSPGRGSVTKSRLDPVTRGVRFTFLGVRPDPPLGDDPHDPPAKATKTRAPREPAFPSTY